MSHCDDGVLNALVDGEIPSTELKPIQEHLGQCAECRTRLEEVRELKMEALDLIAAVELPTAGRAGPAVESSPRISRSARSRNQWIMGLAWAATLVLAVGLGYYAGTAGAKGDMLAVRPTVASERIQPLEESAPAVVPAPATPERDESRALIRGPSRPTPPPPDPRGETAKVEAKESPAAARARVPETVDAEPPARHEADQASAEARPSRDLTRNLASKSPSTGRFQARNPAPIEIRGQQPDSLAKRDSTLRRRLGDREARLDEAVVTGAVGAAKARLEARISAEEAIETLGGTIRLVEGLVPDWYERTADSAVRVAYRVVWGTLYLDQRREGTEVRYELVPPPSAPADSVKTWGERIK